MSLNNRLGEQLYHNEENITIFVEKSNFFIVIKFSLSYINFIVLRCLFGGARDVMVIVAGYGHGDKSSNPGPDWLHFT